VYVEQDTLDEISIGRLNLYDASQVWHRNNSMTVYFSGAKCPSDLLFSEGLKIHFVEECGLFVMTGTGGITFDKTIIEFRGDAVILKTTNDCGHKVVSKTLMLNWRPDGKEDGFENKPIVLEGGEAVVAPAREDVVIFPASHEYLHCDLQRVLITGRVFWHRHCEKIVRPYRKISDLTMRPDGTWWEGVAFYPGILP
jgi:hypothetical protein